MTKPIPDGYHSITAYLTLNDAAAAIEFYKKAFGAEELTRMPSPDGKVMHAELKIGNSIFMLSDSFEEGSSKSPKELGGTTAGIFLYLEDVDTAFKKAVDAGATVTMELQDMFWGDRFGTVKDPFGHSWSMATHVEDLTEEEMGKRGQEAMANMAS